MKKFYILFLSFVAIKSLAQDTTYTLKDFKFSYTVPKTWKHVEFGSANWEDAGKSSVCKCAGTMDIFKIPNGDDYDYIHMVIYPSDKKGQNVEKRRGAWQYRFVPVEDGDSLKTNSLLWTRFTSKFTTTGGENRFKDYKVWQLKSRFGNTYYTMFIWAKPTIFKDYEGKIENIVKTISPIN